MFTFFCRLNKFYESFRRRNAVVFQFDRARDDGVHAYGKSTRVHDVNFASREFDKFVFNGLDGAGKVVCQLRVHRKMNDAFYAAFQNRIEKQFVIRGVGAVRASCLPD